MGIEQCRNLYGGNKSILKIGDRGIENNAEYFRYKRTTFKF